MCLGRDVMMLTFFSPRDGQDTGGIGRWTSILMPRDVNAMREKRMGWREGKWKKMEADDFIFSLSFLPSCFPIFFIFLLFFYLSFLSLFIFSFLSFCLSQESGDGGEEEAGRGGAEEERGGGEENSGECHLLTQSALFSDTQQKDPSC